MFGALTPSLAATGSQLEAVFKTKSDMSSILSVKRAFDRGDKLPLGTCKDPELAAGVMKLYLASLPEPLLTYRLYDSFLALAVITDRGRRTAALARLVQGLPVEVQSTLRLLLPLLARTMQRGPAASKALTSLFAPIFLRLRADESARLAGDISKAESITETLILEHESLLGKPQGPPAAAERSASPSARSSTTAAPAPTAAKGTPVQGAASGRPGTPVLSSAGPLSTTASSSPAPARAAGAPAARDDAGSAQSQFSVYAAAGLSSGASAGSGPLASQAAGAQGPIRGPLSNFTNTIQRHGSGAPPGGQQKPLSPTFSGKKSTASLSGCGAPLSPKLGAGLRLDEKAAVIARLGDSVAATTATLFMPLDGTLVEHVARCIGGEALERARSCFPMALSRRPQGAAPAPSSSSSSAAGSAVYVGVAASGGAHAYPQMPPAALFARGAAAGASAPAAAPAHLDSSGYLSADDGCGFPSAGAPPSAGGGAAFVDEHTLMSAAAECLGIIAAVPAASSTDLAGLLVEKAALKRTLRAFDVAFSNTHGRLPERAEKEPLRPAYARLARVKRRIERVEAAAGFGAAAPAGAAAALPQSSGVAAATVAAAHAETVVRITSTLAGGRRIMC